MKGSYVVFQIEFDAIRNFLERVNREAMDEIRSVLERKEAGAGTRPNSVMYAAHLSHHERVAFSFHDLGCLHHVKSNIVTSSRSARCIVVINKTLA